MTREEALIGIDSCLVHHENGRDCFGFMETLNYINKIYDDIDERTCKNCKYLIVPVKVKQHNHIDSGVCIKPKYITRFHTYEIGNVNFDFGCNMWEKKCTQ